MLKQLVAALVQKVEELGRPLRPLELQKLIRRFPRSVKSTNPFYNKSDILAAYQKTTPVANRNPHLLATLTTKPIRTQSGVATVTILTKPYPCPGNCLFCPNDPAQPKSYLSSEPAAARALKHHFDPFAQVTSRLQNLAAMGHSVSKVELIILGGTFTAYPRDYQEWFIKEALRALEEFNKKKLLKKLSPSTSFYSRGASPDFRREPDLLSSGVGVSHLTAASSRTRDKNDVLGKKEINTEILNFGLEQESDPIADESHNSLERPHNVGLVVETRPDHITPAHLTFLRSLGCTKIQIGIQSVNEELLKKNGRLTTLNQIKRAFALLHLYGFKIHAHFMANLFGATPELDKQDFAKFFSSPDFRPDELKLYPCSLIASAPLYQLFLQGQYQPYSRDQLLDVLTHHLALVPEYCRVTRMIRDISSHDIVSGNKTTNLRQLVEAKTPHIQEIRSREVKNASLDAKNLILDDIIYDTSVSQEHFLQWIDKKTRRIAGFLRLSLPNQQVLAKYLDQPDFAEHYPKELQNHTAIIREVHVYGVVTRVGEKNSGQAQHLGLGTKLIARAEQIALEHHYSSLAVISALGTLNYYKKFGFTQGKGQIYQIKGLLNPNKIVRNSAICLCSRRQPCPNLLGASVPRPKQNRVDKEINTEFLIFRLEQESDPVADESNNLNNNYIDKNNTFYNAIAPHFSKTRQSSWVGWETWWEKIGALLPANPHILDLACGNLRLKKFLDAKLTAYSYLGVDACQGLLNLSKQNPEFYQRLDLLTPFSRQESFISSLRPPHHQPIHDLICCFGFLHHLLDAPLRLAFLQETLKLLKPGGFLVLTFWQPLKNPNLAKRAQELADNNYLLDWRSGTTAKRYCHHYSDAEISTLLAQLPAKIIATYHADGSTHHLNHYVIISSLPCPIV